MDDRPTATSVVPPATVLSGARSIAIDNRPLPASNPWDDGRRSVELEEVDADCWVLKPKKGAGFGRALLIVLASAGPIAGVALMLHEEIIEKAHWGLLLILVIGLLLLFAALLFGLSAPRGFDRWVRFDRRSGLMTVSRRPFGLWRPLQVIRSRPLTNLVCVQLLDDGVHDQMLEIGETGTPGSVIHRNWHSYQLNLVLDDANEPRVNVTTHSDEQWMREAGRCLAEFLNVPLVG